MSEGNNHINYSATDIEKYWKGQLSAAQQHAMEKAALEDPFLADAMEGYEEKARLTIPVITADNDELKKRLAERIAKKQSFPILLFSWWKAAAVFIVLAGAGWLYMAVNNKATDSNNIAKTEAAKKESPPASKHDTATIAVAPLIAVHADSLRDIAVNKPYKLPEKNKAPIARDNTRIADAGAAAPVATDIATAREEAADTAADTIADNKGALATSTAAKKETMQPVTTGRERKVQGIAGDEARIASSALPGRSNSFSNTFNGAIIDQKNKPVANAFIQIPNLNVATQTDKSGYFSFKANDTALSVSIASEGFETQNINLRNKASLNQIILTPVQNNLAEVVVQSNGAEKSKQSLIKTKDLSIKIPDAEPVIGWDEYNKYLEKNKRVTAETAHIHGSVVISFDVWKKGFGNFNIDQSLDDDLDEEATRLIKQGPAWKLLKDKKARATVIVKF